MAIGSNVYFVFFHQLRLQTVNQPLAVEGNYTATVYSVEPAGDNSSDIVITVATDSPDSPADLTDQLTRPLEQTLEEATDINAQISFAIEATQRHGKSFPSWDMLAAVYMILHYG